MIIVPVLDAAAKLDRLLVSLGDQEVLVVDDGSRDAEGIRDVTEYHHAQVVRHTINAGPAAARNTGLHEAETEFVAFIDADCRADAAWPRSLLGHFDDPRVAMVAPRVQPTVEGNSLIERYEATRSSLDMGRQAELVRSGARLGFVPSAAIVVRTAALQDSGFDERMRLGEDVDLTWRLSEAGWLVWYDPSVRVTHETRSEPRAWLVRRFEYGTSAADLETRHPGHLAPVRISAWNLAALALVGLGRPGLGAGVTAVAIGALWRQVASIPGAPVLSARVVVQGLVADAASLGRALRREWWPLGVLALATMPRSQVSRAAAAAMLTPLAWEWATERPPLDPIRYIGMRLVDDAAYGTGVLASSVRSRMLSVLLPKVRLPFRA
jgi:mycofactocin system glycosyltransferase